MAIQSIFHKLGRDSVTRTVRLSSGEASLEAAETIYDQMKNDRPHMAIRLSKLMPKLSDDERHWGTDVVGDHVHIWALKAYSGSRSAYVAILWFEIVEPQFVSSKGVPADNMSSSASTSSSLNGNSGSPQSATCQSGSTAHIEVLWTHPTCRQFGFGTQLVQTVLVRYPNVSKWTAFTSRDLRKDPGVHKFWTKNGFQQESLEIGKVSQDGFFVRNTQVATSKRRRLQTKVFQITESLR